MSEGAMFDGTGPDGRQPDGQQDDRQLSRAARLAVADAHGLPGIHVRCRDECGRAIRHARASAGPVLIDFRVQQEDAVYPMVSPGAALDEMIHAPGTALVETGADLL